VSVLVAVGVGGVRKMGWKARDM